MIIYYLYYYYYYYYYYLFIYFMRLLVTMLMIFLSGLMHCSRRNFQRAVTTRCMRCLAKWVATYIVVS